MSIISGELFFLFLFSFFFLSFKNDFSFSTIIVSVSRLLIYILPWHLDLNFIGIGRISLSVVRDQKTIEQWEFSAFQFTQWKWNNQQNIAISSGETQLQVTITLWQTTTSTFIWPFSLPSRTRSFVPCQKIYIEWIYDQTAATAGKVDGWAVSRVIQRCLKVEFYFVFIIFIHLFMPLQWLYVYSKAIWSLEERKADCFVAKVK